MKVSVTIIQIHFSTLFVITIMIVLLIQFLREQAALSVAEITAEAVNNFVADVEDESDSDLSILSTENEDCNFNWEKILSSNRLSFVSKSCDGFLPVNNVLPKVNGKQNKTVKESSIKINGHSTIRGDSFSEFTQPSDCNCMEAFPGLDRWKSGKFSVWHNVEGNSIQWLCIACVDRKGNISSYYCCSKQKIYIDTLSSLIFK
jgi:GTP pyrophosphokinase